MRRGTTTTYRRVIGLCFGLVLAGCGVSGGGLGDSTTTTTGHLSSTTSTTYAIEVGKFAEEIGATLEEAAAILLGQVAQSEALVRLEELVGEGVVVGGAFKGDLALSDELTVFVVDEEAVSVVLSRMGEAGLDPAKTTVEVAPEESPDHLWNWLDAEQYAGHQWLESPGPHTFGQWRLVESNGAAPPLEILGVFGLKWSLLECKTWIGHALPSVEGTLSVSVEAEDSDCGEATDAVESLVLDVIAENGGEFELGSDGDVMIWQGAAGGSVVWELDESIDGNLALYPQNQPGADQAWSESLAPMMEGIWHLQEVSGVDPVSPVSLYVGVSTFAFEGMCNRLDGFYAITADQHLALNGYATQAQCPGPTGEVEAQVAEAVGANGDVMSVSVRDDLMTWGEEGASSLIWSR